MCGICGVYNLDGRSVEPGLLTVMNRTLIHRGPDDEGYHMDGAMGLGHRRLSIIDLSTGQQPVYNEDKSIVTVFNGEIYNFREIKALLMDKGHVFYTHTDTEVIVHSYEEWGESCVHRFRGMFAFAIWDNKKKVLLLVRDRLGIKPLYYYHDDNRRLSFASEIKALLEDTSLLREMDYEALSDYFSFGYIPPPKSIFKKIKKLPPGYYLKYENNTITLRQYWDLSFEEKQFSNEEDYCDQLIQILRESVQLRLISDVPLGAFLSGGLDSSLVVAMMSGLIHDPVITNSIGFSVQQFNELDYARQTALLFNTSHNEFTVTPDVVDVLEKLSWHYDEPFADSSSIPTYYVSKMARQKVTVALSGDGGDENFAGYRRYYFDQLENRIRGLLPSRVRKCLFGGIAAIYPKGDRLPQIFRAKTFLTNVSKDPVFGYFNSMSMFLPGMKKQLFSKEMQKKLNGYDSMEVFREHYSNCNSNDPLTRVQYIDFKTYLPEDILTKVDRASMANSLEVRVPLLDHKFVEFAAAIPSFYKLRGGDSKYIFKKAARTVLPDSIVSRPKMGFSIPIGQWMQKELKPVITDLIEAKSCCSNDLFNTDVINRMWQNHCNNRGNFMQPLWTYLCFRLWEKKYMAGL